MLLLAAQKLCSNSSAVFIRIFLVVMLGLSFGCGKGTLATDAPGPLGCGLRDPRETSPNMLSMAQKSTFKKRRSIREVRKNEHGGLDWMYRTSKGSVFGEQQSLETVSFDARGILVKKTSKMLRKVGK